MSFTQLATLPFTLRSPLKGYKLGLGFQLRALGFKGGGGFRIRRQKTPVSYLKLLPIFCSSQTSTQGAFGAHTARFTRNTTFATITLIDCVRHGDSCVRYKLYSNSILGMIMLNNDTLN